MKNTIARIGLILVIVWLAGCSSYSTISKTSDTSSAVITTENLAPASLRLTETASVISEQWFTDNAYVGAGRTKAGLLGARAISYNGYQYAIYYEQKKAIADQSERVVDVIVARRHIASGKVDTLRLASEPFTVRFAHHRLAIAVSKSDDSVHAIYSHHSKPQIRYAKTAPMVATTPHAFPWKNTLFKHLPNFGEAELSGVEITYPVFKEMLSGDLLLDIRTGGAYGGELQFATYSGENHSWSPIKMLTSRYGAFRENNNTRGPFFSNGILPDDRGNFRATWLFREREGGCDLDSRKSETETFCNHGLFFTQSRDSGRTWLSHDNRLIADLSEGESISVENASPPPVELLPELAPSNSANHAAIDPVTGDYHILISHLENPGDSKKVVYHYLSDTDGNWIGRTSKFTADRVRIAFVGDYMLAFGGGKEVFIQYSLRKERFVNWYTLPIEYKGEDFSASGGNALWDFGRLHEGIASFIWHKPLPQNSSISASPVEVYDIRFAELVF